MGRSLPGWQALLAGVALILLLPTGAPAQSIPGVWDAGSPELTREELETLQERYRMVMSSSAYSGGLKRQAEVELARVTERLEQGDFRSGDRISMRIEGETALPDTLFVEPGQTVTLPIMGSISLKGVLRSELEEHMTREIGRFIHDPVVRARSLIRLSIQGNVVRPGFYVLPANLLLGDVIMAAGGPMANADLEELEIRRGTEVFLEGSVLQAATVEGRSLDQLNVRAGDALVVPPQKTTSWWRPFVQYGILVASSLLLGFRAIY